MELVAVAGPDHLRDDRGDPAELGVAEGVAGARLGKEPSVRVAGSLRDHDDAVPMGVDAFADAGEEPFFLEGDLGKEDDVGRVAFEFGREASGRRDPARVAAHDLHDEDLGGRPRHRPDVEGGLAHGYRDVLRDRAEAGAVVGDREVVVDRFRDPDAGDGIAHPLADLRHLVGGVLGIPASVVEEVPDIVRAKDVDEPLVLRRRLFQPLELVTARPERAGRGMAERGDRLLRFLAGIDEILGQRADDPVPARVDLAEHFRMATGRLDDSGRRGVDDRGHAAGLGVEDVAGAHDDAFRSWSGAAG